jgi:tetratricopeptide (TPR) repeat protein
MRYHSVRLPRILLLAALACSAAAPTWAEDYWSASGEELSIIAAGNSGRALTLARNLAQYDAALSKILDLSGGRTPTRLYELSAKDLKAVVGSERSASTKFNGYEMIVLTDSGSGTGNPYWGALFGYTEGLLASGRARRSPLWFDVGVAQLFASTEFKGDRVTTAGVAPGFVQTLLNGKTIPARTLLSVQNEDPQLKDSAFMSMFEAKSWFLAREVFVEGKLRAEFGKYFNLMSRGASEPEAFKASFAISYEDLDKMLAAALKEPAHQFVVSVPRPPESPVPPRKLSVAETKAMLAEVSLKWQRRQDALRLANDALQAEPSNEVALRTAALADLEDGRFADSLTLVDKITALPTAHADTLTDTGEVLTRLAHAVEKKEVVLAADASTLKQRAVTTYDKAITVDPSYLRAWGSLAYLYGSTHDAQAARALVERATPVMEQHLHNGALARALAMMCAGTGLADRAFLFAQYWRENAINRTDYEQAQAFVARLNPVPQTPGAGR